MIGGFIFRLGVGALPFLLPLMLQVGFGMTPFQSGLITFASAVGAMTMKMAAATVLRRFGFRTVLVVNALVSAGFLAACASFTQATPVAVMLLLLLVGGFFRSLQFTSINTIAYAEVEPERISRATSLVSVGQQLAVSAGVAFGALAVQLTVRFEGTKPWARPISRRHSSRWRQFRPFRPSFSPGWRQMRVPKWLTGPPPQPNHRTSGSSKILSINHVASFG